MAVDLKKVRERIKKNRSDRARRRKRFAKTFTIEADTSRFVYFLPPHENMGVYPWAERMVHKRELPQGTKAKYQMTCMRENRDEEFDKCPACVMMTDERKLSKVRGDDHDEMAKQLSPKNANIAQVLDVTSLFNKGGMPTKKMKKCLLDYGEHDCEDCHMAVSCEKGIQQYTMPESVYDGFCDYLYNNGNITSFDEALCVRVTRKGAGKFSTKYSPELARESISIPKSVRARINEKIIDLSAVELPPEGKRKEVAKQFKDFYEMVDLEDAENTGDEEELPKCFGKYTDKKAKKRRCKKCEVKSTCIEDDDDDDDDDDDEEVERKPRKAKKSKKGNGDLSDLRRDLKKKSRKGKLNK